MYERKWVRAGPLIAALIVATATTLVAMPLGNTAPDTTFNDVTLIAEEVQYDAILPNAGITSIIMPGTATLKNQAIVIGAANIVQDLAITANVANNQPNTATAISNTANNIAKTEQVAINNTLTQNNTDVAYDVNSSPPAQAADNGHLARDAITTVAADNNAQNIAKSWFMTNVGGDVIFFTQAAFVNLTGVDTSPPTGLVANVINGFSITT